MPIFSQLRCAIHFIYFCYWKFSAFWYNSLGFCTASPRDPTKQSPLQDPQGSFAWSHFNHRSEKTVVYRWYFRYLWTSWPPCMASVWESLYDEAIWEHESSFDIVASCGVGGKYLERSPCYMFNFLKLVLTGSYIEAFKMFSIYSFHILIVMIYSLLSFQFQYKNILRPGYDYKLHPAAKPLPRLSLSSFFLFFPFSLSPVFLSLLSLFPLSLFPLSPLSFPSFPLSFPSLSSFFLFSFFLSFFLHSYV